MSCLLVSALSRSAKLSTVLFLFCFLGAYLKPCLHLGELYALESQRSSLVICMGVQRLKYHCAKVKTGLRQGKIVFVHFCSVRFIFDHDMLVWNDFWVFTILDNGVYIIFNLLILKERQLGF